MDLTQYALDFTISLKLKKTNAKIKQWNSKIIIRF